MNTLLKGLRPGTQLVLFVTLMLTMMGMGSVTAGLLGMFYFDIPLEQLPAILSEPSAEYAKALMWMNNVSQIFSFGLPVLFFFLLFGGDRINGLMLNKGNALMWFAPLVVVFSGVIIDLSSKLNKALIPEGSWLEEQVKPSEDLMEKMTHIFLGAGDHASLILAFFSIAVIPAILEEFTFRGVLQPLFAKITKNIHVAIWLSAAVFSLIHFQFYGFLPRMLLGALLGYLVVWTGTIWSSVIAHFCNNSLAFVIYRFYGSVETPEDSTMNQWYSYLVGGLIFLMLLAYMVKNSRWPWLSFEYLDVGRDKNES
jgi:membrane protease YdiL (CAAX protease family)